MINQHADTLGLTRRRNKLGQAVCTAVLATTMAASTMASSGVNAAKSQQAWPLFTNAFASLSSYSYQSNTGTVTGELTADDKIQLRVTFPEEINAMYVGKLTNGQNFLFSNIDVEEVSVTPDGYTYLWTSDITYDPNTTYDFMVQANAVETLYFAPGDNNQEYYRFVPYVDGKLTPKDGQTLMILGQNIDDLNDFQWEVYKPAAATGYHAIDGTGVYSRFNDVNGPLDNQSLYAGFKQSAFSLASWMVGLEENLADEILAGSGPNLDILNNYLYWFQATDQPIYFRWGYEVDGPWNHYEPDAFITVWRYVYDWIQENEAHNIAMVWQIAGYCDTPYDRTVESTHNSLDYDAWWPGDEYVDWTGLSYFAQPRDCIGNDDSLGGLPPGYGGLSEVDENGNSLALDNIMDYLISKGKPVQISESTPRFYHITDLKYMQSMDITNADELVDITVEEIWNDWYEPYFDFIDKYKSHIRGVAYINSLWERYPGWACVPGEPRTNSNCFQNYWGDSRIQANPLIEENFLAKVNRPRFINDGTVDWFDSLHGWDQVIPVNAPAQRAYTFEHIPHGIPGKIQGEHFDVGGPGVAYNDVDLGNNGREFATDCRTNEDVDIGPIGDAGCSVGWTAEGEWLEYTVDVQGDGEFGTDPIALNVTVAVALPDDGAMINVLIDGNPLLTDIAVPNTGGWDVFLPVTFEGVVIEPGEHVIRVEFSQGGVSTGSPGSFDYIEFQDPGASQPYNETYRFPIPGTFEVEHYNRGKEGAAFADFSASPYIGIVDPCFRDDVAPEDNASYPVLIMQQIDECTVQATLPGEFLEYTVEVIEEGYYDLAVTSVHGGTAGDRPTFRLTLNGGDITGAIETPYDPSWLLQDAIVEDVYLPAGEQRLRLEYLTTLEGHTGVFDKITFTRADAGSDVGQVPYQINTISTTTETIIEGALFDLGGEDIAWRDSSDIYHNGPNSDCRFEEGVDGTVDVNWIDIDLYANGVINCTLVAFFGGEWVEYTINVAEETTFDIGLLNDSGTLNSNAIFEINGANILPAPIVTTSPNWGVYVLDTIEGVTLPAGESVLRLTVGFGGFNIHQIIFTPTSD